MEPSICFVCLSSAHNSFHSEHESSLYSKFCKVSQLYLGISSSLTNYDKGENSGVTKFCDNCELVVSSICQLHQELVAVQLRLSSKLGELGDLLENSELEESEWTSCHSSSSVITSLSKQLGVKNPVVVDTFRSYLKKKCKRERSKSLPVVVAKRMASGTPTSSSGESQKAGAVVDPERNGLQFSCAPEEIRATSNFIKTEPLDEANLSKFVDEGEDEEDNSCFEATPNCDQVSVAALPTMEDNSRRFSSLEVEQLHNPLEEESTTLKNKKGTQFGCPICGRGYSTSWNMRDHIRRAHSNKRFSCQKCNAFFTCKQNLERHLAASHNLYNSKPHACPHCKNTFPSKGYLQRHMRLKHPHTNPPRIDMGKVSSTDIKLFQDETEFETL